MTMIFKTFADLLDSPLSKKDEEIENILVELNVKFGISKLGIRDLKHILSIVHRVYHTVKDINPGDRQDRLWTQHSGATNQRLTISNLSFFSYPSDVIIQNIFKILFKTNVWDSLVLDERLERHVYILKLNAGTNMLTVSNAPSESWRKIFDRRMEKLFEIWSEMLDQISSKKKQLFAI